MPKLIVEVPKQLYLVKNLRGIIYFSKNVSVESELEWLKKKFKYRVLGISETIKAQVEWKRLLTLEKIVEDPVLDSLFQASKFVSPLIILKEKSLKDFKNAVIVSLKANEKLDDRKLKFNIRLVNYAITDFYLKSIELALQHDLQARKKLAEKDLRRFWRIPQSSKGKTLIAYIDPLLIESKIRKPELMGLIPSLILDFD
jgi:hypothetical protein